MDLCVNRKQHCTVGRRDSECRAGAVQDDQVLGESFASKGDAGSKVEAVHLRKNTVA